MVSFTINIEVMSRVGGQRNGTFRGTGIKCKEGIQPQWKQMIVKRAALLKKLVV